MNYDQAKTVQTLAITVVGIYMFYKIHTAASAVINTVSETVSDLDKVPEKALNAAAQNVHDAHIKHANDNLKFYNKVSGWVDDAAEWLGFENGIDGVKGNSAAQSENEATKKFGKNSNG